MSVKPSEFAKRTHGAVIHGNRGESNKAKVTQPSDRPFIETGSRPKFFQADLAKKAAHRPSNFTWRIRHCECLAREGRGLHTSGEVIRLQTPGKEGQYEEEIIVALRTVSDVWGESSNQRKEGDGLTGSGGSGG